MFKEALQEIDSQDGIMKMTMRWHNGEITEDEFMEGLAIWELIKNHAAEEEDEG